MKTQLLFEKWYYEERQAYGMRITSKDKELKWLWKFIHAFLYIVTLGKQDRFYEGFTTTLGKVVYFPAGWTYEKATLLDCVTLRHEGRGHIKQYLKCGLGNAILGTIVMGFLYLFVPLPVCFAWFRYYFEREAYRISYLTKLELGLNPDIKWYVELLSGSSYFWAWISKKQVRAWFEKNCVSPKEKTVRF